ncbi:FAD-binding and (Fe-S)-binding domain-containing protein [Ascidiimonas sp. W6]|uniref:FAD-binding and (Fe-S)-binding domain-containing protein n=1 Tax=Ascidiimonas meishanensis TaxID=3128903 RepID=UPI0030EEEF12
MSAKELFKSFSKKVKGELYIDELHKTLYATDASVYRQKPLGVFYPQNATDIQKVVEFSATNNISLIPRTAGTSLAGQCVGKGLVVDVSKHLTQIFEINTKEKTATVAPGVIRDELNLYLESYGLFFGPNTSTSNRCMIGGMVGNNSSGTTSIQYGVTRDKVLELHTILSDGSEAIFKSLTKEEFTAKCKEKSLEGNIYKTIKEQLSPPHIKEQVATNFPKPEIHRRNTGYAIDALLEMAPFSENGDHFNLCKLLTGSEGTLAFTTKIKIKLDPLPPKHRVMIVAHFDSIKKACEAVKPSMRHSLSTCELMDKVILDCTKNNKSQLPNRFFIQGDPEAILMLELQDKNLENLEKKRNALVATLKKSKLAYAHPTLYHEDIGKVLELRKAGLGLLGNIVGDKKAVACIEDTSVTIDDLAPYIEDFSQLMAAYKQKAVYYAHAGAGELHLRPILDLKKQEEVKLFRAITTDVAKLVKKYNGSLSGEHGDGIVRGEFVEMMIGAENYQILKEIKAAFDPQNIFNPGKIVDAPPMDLNLRYQPDRKEPEIHTLLDFTDSLGILRAAEKCNGSGDCRKTHIAKGTMCPSYHATKNEKDTTRARANALRDILTHSTKQNKFNHKELKDVFDLCLSCKACSSECPSNVDIATLKAEFLYQYQQTNGTSLRDKSFAYNTQLNAIAAKFPLISNTIFSGFTGNILKKALGIAPERSIPKVAKVDFEKHALAYRSPKPLRSIILYIDEFTRYLDTDLGKDAIEVFSKLGYLVKIFYAESGRTFISKGFLKHAKVIANSNINELKSLVSKDCPLIGLEPSALLSFRDEYPRLVHDKEAAVLVAENSFLVEEFISNEILKGFITKTQFKKEAKHIKIHSHCHQKALSNQKCTFEMLNLPENYQVSIITSGCCGMAGSFGYEKEHYEVSMQVGELKLFPAIRKSSKEVLIAANGTSCRHQIFDGTSRNALHPISIFKQALL